MLYCLNNLDFSRMTYLGIFNEVGTAAGLADGPLLQP